MQKSTLECNGICVPVFTSTIICHGEKTGNDPVSTNCGIINTLLYSHTTEYTEMKMYKLSILAMLMNVVNMT